MKAARHGMLLATVVVTTAASTGQAPAIRITSPAPARLSRA